MENTVFRAYVVSKTEGGFQGEIKQKKIRELPGGDLLVKVKYSSLNYKDYLSATGNPGVTKEYPHTPGIDAVGEVVSSVNGKFVAGDKVIVTSYDLGMNTPGGFGEYIRVPSNWVVKLPENLSMKEAMVYGTAGFTAGLSVLKITEQVGRKDGKIAISGVTGGVGIISLAILAKLDYTVTAITGKSTVSNFLFELGAREVMYRSEIEEENKRPLLKANFAGAIDTLGGPVLDNIIKSTLPNGIVTSCGNAASAKLNLTVYPFILRGISLVGIDSQNCPMPLRKKVWEKLAGEYKIDDMDKLVKEIELEDLPEYITLMQQGKHVGRVLIKHK